jgi:hypothetical protein
VPENGYAIRGTDAEREHHHDQPASKFYDMIHEREIFIAGHAVHAG